MALKAGDLYVNVTANIGEFSKSMKKVADDIAKVASKIESFGAKIGAIGTVLSAGMAGALLASAQWSSETQAQLDRVKQTFLTFAAEIGDALLPFLRQFGDRLQTLLGMWQGLSPRLKTIIVDTIAYGAAIGVAGGAVGKLAGVVGGMAQLFSAIALPVIKSVGVALASLSASLVATETTATAAAAGLGSLPVAAGAAATGISVSLGAILAPLAAVAAAVVGVIALAGTLYHVWKDNSEAIKAAMSSAWASVKGVLSKIGSFFVDVLGGVVNFFKAMVVTILDGFALLIRSQARMMETVAKTLHLDGLAKMLEPLTTVTGEKMAAAIFDGVSSVSGKAASVLGDVGSSLGESISYGAKYAWAGVEMGGTNVADALKAKFAAIFGGGTPGTIRGAPTVATPDAVGPDAVGPVRSFQSLAGFAPKDNEHFLGISRNFTALEKMIRSNLDQIRQVGQTVADDFADGFVNMANGVEGSFRTMVTSILADLERLAAHKAFDMLLNLGMNALGNLGGISDPTGQNYTVGGSDVMTAVRGLGDLRASPLHATTNFVINIQPNGTATTDAQGGTAQMQQMAKGLKAVVERHLQEQMRPGGTIYNFARAR